MFIIQARINRKILEKIFVLQIVFILEANGYCSGTTSSQAIIRWVSITSH